MEKEFEKDGERFYSLLDRHLHLSSKKNLSYKGMFKSLSLPSITRYALVHAWVPIARGYPLTLPQQRTMYNGCAYRFNYDQGLRTPEFFVNSSWLTVLPWIRYFFPGLSFFVKGSVVPHQIPSSSGFTICRWGYRVKLALWTEEDGGGVRWGDHPPHKYKIHQNMEQVLQNNF